MYEEFRIFVSQVFDPNQVTELSREASKQDIQKMLRTFEYQVQYRARLMEKRANRNMHGPPPYLRRYQYYDEDLPNRLTKQVLDGTYDYKADDKKQKAMFEWKEKTIKRGGPLTQKVW